MSTVSQVSACNRIKKKCIREKDKRLKQSQSPGCWPMHLHWSVIPSQVRGKRPGWGRGQPHHHPSLHFLKVVKEPNAYSSTRAPDLMSSLPLQHSLRSTCTMLILLPVGSLPHISLHLYKPLVPNLRLQSNLSPSRLWPCLLVHFKIKVIWQNSLNSLLHNSQYFATTSIPPVSEGASGHTLAPPRSSSPSIRHPKLGFPILFCVRFLFIYYIIHLYQEFIWINLFSLFPIFISIRQIYFP